MMKRGQHLRLARGACKTIRIACQRGRHNTLIATSRPKLRVACAIDLAHAARADGGDDFVRPESSAGTESHQLS
jgi:hypothetical protein